MAIIDSGTLWHGVSGTFYVGTTGTAIPAIRLSDRNNIPTILNSGRLDTDLRILPTGTQVGLFFDASTSRLGINTLTPSGALHVKDVCADGGLVIESSSYCANGVALNLFHNPGPLSNTGDFPASINLMGTDKVGTPWKYAQICSSILNPTAGQTSGVIILYVDKTGTLYPIFSGSPQRIVAGFGNNIRDGLFETTVGSNNYVQYGDNSTTVGSNNRALDFLNGLLIGYNNAVSGTNNIGIINTTLVSGLSNTVYGSNDSVVGSRNIGFGVSGSTSGSNNIFVGNLVKIVGNSGLMLGSSSSCSGNNNISVGANNSISGNYNLYYGNNGIIEYSNDILGFGNAQNIVSSTSGIYVGNNISSSGSNQSIVIGLSNLYEKIPYSLLFGNSNAINNSSSGFVLFGQSNTLINGGSGCLVVGQMNNVSGNLNNVYIGQVNDSYGNSNNNIVIGMLNNRTGVSVVKTGILNYGSGNIDGLYDHSIIVGINNNAVNSDNSFVVGHKNSISGNNNSVLGSFNISSSKNNQILGNSNASIGEDNISVGKNSRVFGYGNIKIGNSGSIYGDNLLSIGNNRLLSNGSVVGSNNTINNSNNTVYGSNNTIGSTISYSFTIDDNKIIIPIPTSNLLDISNNDTVALYLLNQNINPAYIEYLVADKQSYGGSSTSFSISKDQSNLFNLISSFNENSSTPTVISGILTKIISSTNISYGKDNLVLGNNNSVFNSGCTIIGQQINTTGNNLTVIGKNISYSGDNTLVIGSDSNRIILSDEITFNSLRTQTGLSILSSFNLNTVQKIDLFNNRVGINKDNPTAVLDVAGDASFNSLRIIDGAISGYSLTTDGSGIATWQKPVAIAGSENSIAILSSDSTISGINSMVFIPENTGLNFYDSSILLSPTGNIFRNDPTLFVNIDDDILLGFIPQSNNVIIKNVNIESATITSSVSLPASSLSGGLLYVQNNGTLTSNRPSTKNSIIYANEDKNPDASSKFRYFETGNILALGDDDNLDNGFNKLNYNIILSSNANEDTTFNKQKLNNNFTIYATNSAETPTHGLHYSNSGVLVINGDAPLPYNSDPVSADYDTRLKVFGKVYADQFKTAAMGSSSGWYLRASDNNGNLELQPLTLPLNQTAFYPISTSLDVANNYKIQLTQYKAYNSATLLAGGNDIDGGKTLVFKGGGLADDKWAVSSNFRARQGGCGSCFQGIEFGERASILQSNHMMAYSAGSFKVLAGNLY
jgi:hypothetical protein